MKEPTERMIYRMECEHHGIYDHCYQKSGYSGNIHVSFACTPDTDCPRMKRYDKLHKQ